MSCYYPRKIVVIQQLKDFDKWKDSVSYGKKRWIAETVFSCIKRRFGEYVSAIKFDNMVKEIMIKISLYNCLSPWYNKHKQKLITTTAN